MITRGIRDFVSRVWAAAPVAGATPPIVGDVPGFCPECGAAAESGGQFCGECGFDLRQLAAPVAVPAAPTPSATGGAAAPTMVMRSPAAIAGILAALLTLALGGYVLYDSFATSGQTREMPAVPTARAGTLTEFPIDSTDKPTPAKNNARIVAPLAQVPVTARPATRTDVAVRREPAPPTWPTPVETVSAPVVMVLESARAPIPTEPPAKGTYTGAATGTIRWSGAVDQDGTITFDGDRPSTGTMSGALPGVPVLIQLLSKELAVVEAPSAASGWKRMTLRSRSRQSSLILQWTVLP